MAFLAPIAAGLAAAAPIISLVGTVIGVGAQIAGQQASAQAAMQLSDYRAEVARRNAAISEQNATQAITVSQRDQQQIDMKNRQVIGEQIAAQSSSGIALGSGSFVRSRAATRTIAAIDRMNVRQAGYLQMINYKQQAQEYRDEAAFLVKTRDNAQIAAMFQSIGTLAQGFTGLDYSKFSPSPATITPASERWGWSSI